jgi:Heavy-metal resistance
MRGTDQTSIDYYEFNHGITMTTLRFSKLTMFLVPVIVGGCVNGQHQHSHDSAAGSNVAATYAGQQTRSIKALSAQEVRDLLEGKGMGLAKAAELNGYPGPMHTLENARAMSLSEDQKANTLALMNAHKARVKAMGQTLVAEERSLDTLFSQGKITPEALDSATQKIGQLQAEIRADHLRTHLEQTALLSKAQIAKYNSLRGYTH